MEAENAGYSMNSLQYSGYTPRYSPPNHQVGAPVVPKCYPGLDWNPDHVGPRPRSVKIYRGHASKKFQDRMRISAPEVSLQTEQVGFPSLNSYWRPATQPAMNRSTTQQARALWTPSREFRTAAWSQGFAPAISSEPLSTLPRLPEAPNSSRPSSRQIHTPSSISQLPRSSDLQQESSRSAHRLPGPSPLVQPGEPAKEQMYQPWGDADGTDCGTIDATNIRITGAVKAEEDDQHFLIDMRHCNQTIKFATKRANVLMRFRNKGWDPRICYPGNLFGSYGTRAVCDPGMPHKYYQVTNARNDHAGITV